jgi:uncharacterized damage-inducible protein DinB
VTSTGGSLEDFLAYLERVRDRTRRLAVLIPPRHINWAPKLGAMTTGDLVRHIAVTERFVWAETVAGRRVAYTSHGSELANTHADVIAYFDALHAESLEIFRALTPEQYRGECLTPAGSPIPVWKWLRAMVEHEVHHRGQLYLALSLLGVETPPLFGLTSEDLRTLARGSVAR